MIENRQRASVFIKTDKQDVSLKQIVNKRRQSLYNDFDPVYQVDPNNDVFGSYGTGSGKKRYNHTCEEYEQGEVSLFTVWPDEEEF